MSCEHDIVYTGRDGIIRCNWCERVMHVMILYVHDGLWCTYNTDPETARIMGTRVLATPYDARTTAADDVSYEIEKLNPDHVIMFEERANKTWVCAAYREWERMQAEV